MSIVNDILYGKNGWSFLDGANAFYNSQTNKYALPISQIDPGFNGYGDSSGAPTYTTQGYRIFDRLGNSSPESYNGMSYDYYDTAGNKQYTGTLQNQGLDGFTKLIRAGIAAAGTMGVGATIAGAGAAGAGAGAGAASGATVPTAAQAAASAGSLEAALAPYLAGGAGAGAAGGLASLLGGAGGALKGASGLASILGALGGGSGNSGGGGLNLGNLLGLLGGGVDASRQGEAAEKMLSWLNGQSAKMEALYSPDSPESKHLWEEMSRKDAAAGRNSQYGPRTSDFAAKVATDKAANIRGFTTGTSRAYADALNQDASKYSGLLGALGNMTGGSGLDISSILNMLGGSGTDLGGGMSIDQLGNILGRAEETFPGGTMSNDDIWEIINGGSAGEDPFSLFW